MMATDADDTARQRASTGAVGSAAGTERRRNVPDSSVSADEGSRGVEPRPALSDGDRSVTEPAQCETRENVGDVACSSNARRPSAKQKNCGQPRGRVGHGFGWAAGSEGAIWRVALIINWGLLPLTVRFFFFF